MISRQPNFFLEKLYLFVSSPKLGWCLCISYILTATFSMIQFQVWDQVLWFWERDMPFDPVNIFMYKNEFRYYLLLPALELSRSLNVDYDWLFSILVTLYLLLTACLITHIAIGLGVHKNHFWTLFNTNAIFFISLSLFMNGRLASGFAGIAIIQLCLLYKFKKQIHNALFLPLVFLGLWLCSISSGVFLVSNLTLYFGIALYLLDTFKKMGLNRDSVILAVLYFSSLNFFLIVILVDAHSELFYYDYSLFQMLQHGTGKAFWEYGYPGVGGLGVLGILSLYFFHKLWHKFPEYRILFIPIALSLGFGLFGYSTLLTCLPAALCLFNIFSLGWIDGRSSLFISSPEVAEIKNH